MIKVSDDFRGRGFWLQENRRYAEPYFRLQKCARIANEWSRGRACDMLDIGCGPATLRELLRPNIRYYGIDLALQETAPYLRELDCTKNEISFEGRIFDIVVAGGVFEYLGTLQNKKLLEIRALLKPHGLFLVTYTNFDHVNDRLIDHSPYNNVKPLAEFKRELETVFRVLKYFPSSHNWYCSEPRRPLLKALQMPLRVRIPYLSTWFAVNYFFVCV